MGRYKKKAISFPGEHAFRIAAMHARLDATHAQMQRLDRLMIAWSREQGRPFSGASYPLPHATGIHLVVNRPSAR